MERGTAEGTFESGHRSPQASALHHDIGREAHPRLDGNAIGEQVPRDGELEAGTLARPAPTQGVELLNGALTVGVFSEQYRTPEQGQTACEDL